MQALRLVPRPCEGFGFVELVGGQTFEAGAVVHVPQQQVQRRLFRVSGDGGHELAAGVGGERFLEEQAGAHEAERGGGGGPCGGGGPPGPRGPPPPGGGGRGAPGGTGRGRSVLRGVRAGGGGGGGADRGRRALPPPAPCRGRRGEGGVPRRAPRGPPPPREARPRAAPAAHAHLVAGPQRE